MRSSWWRAGIAGMVFLLVLVGLGTGIGQGQASNYRVALVLEGPINDGGWNTSAYNGLQEARELLGIEVAYSERVPQAEFETALRDYARRGYNLVIGHGFQFEDAMLTVAPEFPHVHFAITGGLAYQEPNLAAYNANNWHSGFLAGLVAGMVTETKKVGAIGGVEIPTVVDSLKGFEAGVKAIVPDAEVTLLYVGSWRDVAKGKEMAVALLDSGADVIMPNADEVGLGVIEAVRAAGKKAVGFIADQTNTAPDTVVATGILSMQQLVVNAIRDGYEGRFRPQYFEQGIVEGVSGLAINPAFEHLLDLELIERMKAGLASGEIRPES